MVRLRLTAVAAAWALTTVPAACRQSERADEEVGAAVVADVMSEIGSDESAGPEYVFGSISAVALGPQDRVYVADRQSSNVRVFTADGVHLRTIGREGDGPGEFRVPSDLVFFGSELWVADVNRIQQFLPRVPGGVPDSVGVTRVLTGYANTSGQRSRVIDGDYYYPRYFYPIGGGFRYFYEVFRAKGGIDTIAVPPVRNLERVRRASYRGARVSRAEHALVSTLSQAPFEPKASWDLTGRGTIVAGPGTSTALQEFDALGNVLEEIELPFARREIPTAERLDTAQALTARLRQLSVPLQEVENVSGFLLDGELPDSLPTHLAIHVAVDDRIWVRTWPSGPPAQGTEFAVISPQHSFESLIRIPVQLSSDVAPYFRGNQVTGVIADPATGAQTVVVARAGR